jgi:hypothetical protein
MEVPNRGVAMPTIELPKEIQTLLDKDGVRTHFVDPRTNREYMLLPVDDIQAYLDFVDSRAPEQIAWSRMAAKNLAKQLKEDA